MQGFIHRRNVEHYEKLLAATTDTAKRTVLLQLLADERAKVLPLEKANDNT